MRIKLSNHLKGFTLIELMVAIAIVAILATVGFTLLQSAQAAGRDSKRRSDIDAISQALETNWNPTTSMYPQLTTANEALWFTTGAAPTDPLASGIYTYAQYGSYSVNVAGASATYILCARLEKAGGNASAATATTITSASGTGAVLYCKKNQQQ